MTSVSNKFVVIPFTIGDGIIYNHIGHLTISVNVILAPEIQ